MIPVFELTRQYKLIKTELDQAVKSVMEHGVFTLGPQVKAFEQEFGRYLGIKHCVGVASGTDALTIALKTLGIGPGDELIIPANAYPTAFGVALSGAKIRLVDCGEDGNISVDGLANKLTKKTKIVIPVHLYGNPADIFSIKKLLKDRHSQTQILEDAAQAHGAEINYPISQLSNKPIIQSNIKDKIFKVGTIGDIGIFSFYPSKNLGAYGDGGMIVTDNDGYAQKLVSLRMYGETSRYHSVAISGVSRLDEMQAAILRVKLKYLDSWNKRRGEIADYYIREFKGVGDVGVFISPAKSCHHLFVIRTKKRDELQKYLTDNGIGCAIHYPVTIHLTPSFKSLGYKKGDFPEAEAQAREVLSLPMFPELIDSETEEVVKNVKRFFKTIFRSAKKTSLVRY